jgi:hypothetical protein
MRTYQFMTLTVIIALLLLVGFLFVSPGDTAVTGRALSPDQQKTGAPYTNFCQKQFFNEKKGKLICNWEESFAITCASTFPNKLTFIEKGAIISGPDLVGNCGAGLQPIVKVTSN